MKLLVGVVLTKELALNAQEMGERLVKLEKLADCLLIIDNAYRGFEEVQKFLPQSAVIIKRRESDEINDNKEWRNYYVNGRCVVIRSDKRLKQSECYNFVFAYSQTYEYGWALILRYVPSTPEIVSTSKEVAVANERLGVVCSHLQSDSYLVLTNRPKRATTKEEELEMYNNPKSPWRIYDEYLSAYWGFINPFSDENNATFWHYENAENEYLMELAMEGEAYEPYSDPYERLDPPSDAFDSEGDYWDWKLTQ